MIKLELNEQEAQLAMSAFSRACSHIGSELAQTGVNNAMPAAQMLAGVTQLVQKIQTQLQAAQQAPQPQPENGEMNGKGALPN